MTATDLQLSLPTSVGVATYPPGATFGPRAMRDYEFVWLIEGDASYRWGDVTVEAPAGSILLCRPGAEDFFLWDSRRRTRHAYFHFDVHSIPSTWPAPDTWPIVRRPGEPDVLQPLFRHLLGWGATGDPVRRRLMVGSLLAAFVTGESAAGDVPRAALPEAVEAAWACLTRRLDEDPAGPISLADLADAACVTPEHLCRLFRVATGRTPVETVRLARLDRSVVLLARSNYSVAEVARLCGFSSPFHFSRRFSDAFGQSPRQMRQSVRDGAAPPLSLLLSTALGPSTP